MWFHSPKLKTVEEPPAPTDTYTQPKTFISKMTSQKNKEPFWTLRQSIRGRPIHARDIPYHRKFATTSRPKHAWHAWDVGVARRSNKLLIMYVEPIVDLLICWVCLSYPLYCIICCIRLRSLLLLLMLVLLPPAGHRIYLL